MNVTPTDGVALVVAVVIVPILSAIITRPTMSATQKRVVVLTVCVVVGALHALVTGAVEGVPDHVVVYAVKVLGVVVTLITFSQGIYRLCEPWLRKLAGEPNPERLSEGFSVEPGAVGATGPAGEPGPRGPRGIDGRSVSSVMLDEVGECFVFTYDDGESVAVPLP